jgi:hypothetical protein
LPASLPTAGTAHTPQRNTTGPIFRHSLSMAPQNIMYRQSRHPPARAVL